MASQSYLREAKSYAVAGSQLADFWGMWVVAKANEVLHTSYK